MNLPGTASGNWRWRFRSGDLLPQMAGQLKEMVVTYER
jgi:4-alpha-glucanotransferase